MLQIGGGQNFHESVIRVIRNLLQHGREVRLQPFNEYRKKFVLKPYKSFSELTGECRKPKLINCFSEYVNLLSLILFCYLSAVINSNKIMPSSVLKDGTMSKHLVISNKYGTCRREIRFNQCFFFFA